MGAFLASKEVLPDMIQAKAGTIIFTGATAMVRGGANFANLAVGKFGLRALSQSLAKEVGPLGIHVTIVNIDGFVDLERTRKMFPKLPDEAYLKPEAVADVYWNLHVQHKSTWTQELDLRPHVEKW